MSIVLKDVGEYCDHILNYLIVTGQFKWDIQVPHVVSTCFRTCTYLFITRCWIRLFLGSRLMGLDPLFSLSIFLKTLYSKAVSLQNSILCVRVLPACMFVYHMYAWCP